MEFRVYILWVFFSNKNSNNWPANKFHQIKLQNQLGSNYNLLNSFGGRVFEFLDRARRVDQKVAIITAC